MDNQILRPYLQWRQHLVQLLLFHRYAHRGHYTLLLHRNRPYSLARQLQQRQVRRLHYQQFLERAVWGEQWVPDLGRHGWQGYCLSGV